MILHNEAVSFRRLIANPSEDFIRINRDGDVAEHNCIIDLPNKALLTKAHRDAFQLIPDDEGKRYQFGLAEISNVIIRYNFIDSGNKLQGVFQSDGLADNLHVYGNRIDTQGQHYITIDGLLSGFIHNNRDANGELCPVRLGPPRIGGRPEGGRSVYVISFADRTMQPTFDIVEDGVLVEPGIIPDCDGNAHVIDERLGHKNPKVGDVYLYDFHLSEYQSERNCISESGVMTPEEFQNLAMDYGKQVYFT